ncbi:MAG TPA: AAA family ATPase, partial [Polyangiaceae bacterium]
LLMKVIEVLALPDEPIVADAPTRISIDEGYDVPTIRTRYGVVPLTHASAGVRRILGLAYLLVWAWREHSLASALLKREPERRLVLLVDEPETHLHPKWQRLIVPALLRAVAVLMTSEGVEPQALVAAHSPLVLASLEPVFDETLDTLFDLDMGVDEGGGATVEVKRPVFRRRGDVGAWLTSEVFDLKSARSAPAEAAIDDATKALSDPTFDAARAQKIDASLRAVLGDTDPFWIRWRFVGEQRGWLS